MNKVFKTILISLIGIFGVGFLLIPTTFAQANDNLVVQFEQTPLFSETNFLPGQSVTRWVKVTNNSASTQRIATEAINVSDPNRLGDALNLEIKEGESRLYNGTLSQFFNTGEVFLSDLAGNGSQTQYDFIVTFYSGANNAFQGRALGFDILIGFQGTEGGLAPGGGGGGGGFLPPGLTIQEESVRVTTTTETSVTIIWTTSYFSTSQVIYDTLPGKFDLSIGPPNYGYSFSKEGDDSGQEKATAHSVTLTGLLPNTTYYFRCVSHGSLAISQEHSFATLRIKGEEKVEEEVILPEEEMILPEEEIPFEEEILVPEEIVKLPEELIEEEVPEEIVEEVIVEEEIEKRSLGEIFATEGLIAAIGALPLNLKLILIIFGIIILGLIFLWLIRKRKKRKAIS